MFQGYVWNFKHCFLLTDSIINNIEIGRILAIIWLFYVLT